MDETVDEVRFEVFKQAIQMAYYDVRPYCGRGMRHDCIAYTVSPSALLCSVAAITSRMLELFKDTRLWHPNLPMVIWSGALWDSMGRDYIVYFPSVKWVNV